jgi:hypothetical protein
MNFTEEHFKKVFADATTEMYKQKVKLKGLSLEPLTSTKKIKKKNVKKVKTGKISNMKYDDCLELNKMWTDYMLNVVPKDPDAILKADYHGALIEGNFCLDLVSSLQIKTT